MSFQKKIFLCLAVLAVLTVVGSFIIFTGWWLRPSIDSPQISTTQSENNIDSPQISTTQSENNSEIQWEDIYSEFEAEIISSYGEIDAEKLTSETPFEESNPNDTQSYQIKLSHIDKNYLLKLTAMIAHSHGLKYETKSLNRNKEIGFQVNFLKGAEQKLIILFFEIHPPEKEDRNLSDFSNQPFRTGFTSKKLAIIIDDLGNNYPIFQRLLKIDRAITYSILPMLPLSRQISREAHEQGHEILLHTPMEPKDMIHNNPGPGVLLINDSPLKLAAKLKQNLDSISFAVGINNHMGSAFTQDKDSLDQIMVTLSEKGLFFIDSKTAPGNISRTSALNHGVLYLSRNIFLDNATNTEYITRQLNKAANIALKHGYAIAIGHPHAKTIEVLESELQGLDKRGISIVPVSSLLAQ